MATGGFRMLPPPSATLFGEIAGKHVIDLCAAPGGKTAQLVAAGAQVTAIDNGRKRIDRLRRNLKRLKLDANIVYGDGRTYQPDAPVDHILLDALLGNWHAAPPTGHSGTQNRRGYPHLPGNAVGFGNNSAWLAETGRHHDLCDMLAATGRGRGDDRSNPCKSRGELCTGPDYSNRLVHSPLDS